MAAEMHFIQTIIGVGIATSSCKADGRALLHA